MNLWLNKFLKKSKLFWKWNLHIYDSNGGALPSAVLVLFVGSPEMPHFPVYTNTSSCNYIVKMARWQGWTSLVYRGNMIQHSPAHKISLFFFSEYIFLISETVTCFVVCSTQSCFDLYQLIMVLNFFIQGFKVCRQLFTVLLTKVNHDMSSRLMWKILLHWKDTVDGVYQ